MLTTIQYQMLKTIAPGAPDCCDGSVYEGKSKLAVLMGDEIFTKIAGKVVIDFGCGDGADSVAMAARGAKRVIIPILGRSPSSKTKGVNRGRSKHVRLRTFNE